MVPDNKDSSAGAAGDSVDVTKEPETSNSEQSENNATEAVGSDSDAASVNDNATDAGTTDSESPDATSQHPEESIVIEDSDSSADNDVSDAESEVAALRSSLETAEAKANEHWDRLLRLQAEMENQRKRAQNDVTKARKFALESIVEDLLPVKDSLEMGLNAATAEDADPKSIVEGAELTLKMLAQVFEKNNIQEINPVDEKFDPEFHQAMSMQEIEGKAPNTVTSVMQKGYTLNERLVRPALVMVAK